MSTEIRKLKDGSITVLPLTVGSAVNLDDGTTVQDLADRTNRKTPRLDADNTFKVVVAKCIPQHPKIGMRYYYPGGVFGVKYKKKESNEERDQDFIKTYYIEDDSRNLINIESELGYSAQSSYHILADASGVPLANYDKYDVQPDSRKPFLLITITDGSNPNDYVIPVTGGNIYMSIKQVINLNCDTYSPYLKVIDGFVRNIETITPPSRPSNKKTINRWNWLSDNFPKNCNPGLLFRYYIYADGGSMPSVIYNNSPQHGHSWSLYVNFSTRKKRNNLVRPKGRKNIKFSAVRNPYSYRQCGSSGVMQWVSSGHRTYAHIRKLPYRIIYICLRYLENLCNNGSRRIFGDFSVNTFRRGRKSINNCFVQACAKNDGKYASGIYSINTDTHESGYYPIDEPHLRWLSSR